MTFSGSTATTQGKELRLAIATKRAATELKETGRALRSGLARSGAAASEELDGLLSSLSEKVADVRSALAAAAEDGSETVTEGVDSLVKQTRKGVRNLDKRWQKMDRKQKVAVVGGLLAVLAAAAAAPTLVRKAKENW